MLKINQLVIIAGTACVGKTTLIKKIRHGDCNGLCEQLGIENPFMALLRSELSQIRQPIVERLVLHYDFSGKDSRNGEYRELCELISKSDNVTILTLCTSNKILSQRITLRLRQVFHRRCPHPRRDIFILWKKRRVFRDIFKVVALYKRWFKFVNGINVTDHLLVDTTKPSIAKAYSFEMDEVKRILMN